MLCISLYMVQGYVSQALGYSDCHKGRRESFFIPPYGSCFILPNVFNNLSARKATQISSYIFVQEETSIKCRLNITIIFRVGTGTYIPSTLPK